MKFARTPLLHRHSDAPLAMVSSQHRCFGAPAGLITANQFLHHCYSLAEQLPDQKYAINLCANRYQFMVAFCAIIIRQQINLLPPNKNIATQQRLNSLYNNCYLLHDNATPIDHNIGAVNIDLLTLSTTDDRLKVPIIASDQLAAISFTSGSTGDSKPNLKYWASLKRSSDINFAHMIPVKGSTVYQVATVPAQHMWGLETSILLPLHHDVCVLDSRPFYPADIVHDLQSLPAPRMLVTTPIHLRSLIDLPIIPPEVSLTLCATSPLSQSLAAASECKLSGQLREVYGCSEVGSMAVRNTARDSVWQLFDGIRFTRAGEQLIAQGDHLPQDTILQDSIRRLSEQRFELVGRTEDMVDIAGKRGSLSEINQVLLTFDGLVDGIVLHPPKQSPAESVRVRRLAAIVVLKPGVSKKSLQHHFRTHLDSAFVPRPIYLTEHMPREESGKLSKQKIHELYESFSASSGQLRG